MFIYFILNNLHLTSIWIFKMLICLTSLQDRRRLQFGQAISLDFIENWEGNWSGIESTIYFGLFCFVLVLQLCI